MGQSKFLLAWQKNIGWLGDYQRVHNLSRSDLRLVHFANQEWKVIVNVTQIKNHDIHLAVSFIENPNLNLVKTMLVVDALQRVGARSITLIALWLSYSPQNRLSQPGEPLSLKLIIRLLETAGVDRFIIGDLHHMESLAFFHRPVIHLSLIPQIAAYLKTVVKNKTDWLVVAPDKGSLTRAKNLASYLNLEFGWLTKTRYPDRIEFGDYHGRPVAGKKVILIDDFSASGGTLLLAARKLKREYKAEYVVVCLSHLLVDKRNISELVAKPEIDLWLVGNQRCLDVVSPKLRFVNWRFRL